jgi:lipopolysaccharide transport system permease protein
MIAWTFFSTGATNAAASLVSGASMITKVYFPRLALPISAVAGAAVDFVCAAVVLVPLMAFYTVAPTIRIVALPVFFVIATAASLGVGAMFAALNVRYRDVRYVIPFLMQLWLFATPIVYSSSALSERWRTVYAINPMVGVVDGFRWSLLADGPRPGWTTVVSTFAALAMLVGGVAYFRATEDSFADVI